MLSETWCVLPSLLQVSGEDAPSGDCSGLISLSARIISCEKPTTRVNWLFKARSGYVSIQRSKEVVPNSHGSSSLVRRPQEESAARYLLDIIKIFESLDLSLGIGSYHAQCLEGALTTSAVGGRFFRERKQDAERLTHNLLDKISNIPADAFAVS